MDSDQTRGVFLLMAAIAALTLLALISLLWAVR
jgi:hypothetical protein